MKIYNVIEIVNNIVIVHSHATAEGAGKKILELADENHENETFQARLEETDLED